ncbi:hypothetical protein SUDANB95_07888 (plasmid) [Actinosynnema sp. ALI-1.44]
MIRHGRQAVNRGGVAALYGLKMTTFKGGRNRTPPWEEKGDPEKGVPGHPAPINLDPAGKVEPKTYLYDLEQAQAYAAGHPVPVLDGLPDHEEDLLTERESAAYLDMSLAEFRDAVKSFRIPPADQAPYGVNHWFRRTLDEVVFPGKGVGGGPPASVDEERTPRQRMLDVLKTQPADEEVGVTELARRARVSLATARDFLRAPRLRLVAAFTGPFGPDIERWDRFAAAVRELAESGEFADLPIEFAEK